MLMIIKVYKFESSKVMVIYVEFLLILPGCGVVSGSVCYQQGYPIQFYQNKESPQFLFNIATLLPGFLQLLDLFSKGSERIDHQAFLSFYLYTCCTPVLRCLNNHCMMYKETFFSYDIDNISKMLALHQMQGSISSLFTPLTNYIVIGS